MDEFFDQVERAAHAGIYFVALACALMIPDICGALEQPDGEARAATYKAWFDAQMAPLYVYGGTQFLDGETSATSSGALCCTRGPHNTPGVPILGCCSLSQARPLSQST